MLQKRLMGKVEIGSDFLWSTFDLMPSPPRPHDIGASHTSTLGDVRPGHKNHGRNAQGCVRWERRGKVAKTVKSQCPLCG